MSETNAAYKLLETVVCRLADRYKTPQFGKVAP